MKSLRLLTIASLTFLGACATVETSTPTGADDRSPLGKADNIGSCQGAETDFCGEQSEGTCWCDDLCEDFGDCCGDKAAVCDDADIDLGELCLTDDACGDDQFCDHTECLSPDCPEGFACPAVCFGECKDSDDSDDKCGDGTPALCAAIPPQCEPGQFAPVIDHCWGPCIDVDECFDVDPDPGECTDGSFALCEIVPPVCPDGLVLSVQNNCFGPCVDPETCEPPAALTCDEIVPALATETTAILSCTEDAECGQVLSGTSCGCTRNMVARLDADISTWENLREDFSDQECGPGLISTCDCPLADGFACVEGSCTWNYL